MSRRSGTLQLATPAQTGEIVFRLGKVVAGFRSDAPESVGEAMMRQGLVSPTTFQDMLGAQSEGKIGMALFEAYNLRGEPLENILEDLLKRIIYAMFEWKDGTFSFVLDEQADPWSGFGLERARAVAERGLNPQYLAIEGARLRDEHTKENPLDSFVALNEAPPDAALTAASSEALARSLQPSADDPTGSRQAADEDWSQVQLETAAPILPEVKLVPGPPPEPTPTPPTPDLAALASAEADDKVIPFPAGGRAGLEASAKQSMGTRGGQAMPALADLEELNPPEAAPQPVPQISQAPDPIAEPTVEMATDSSAGARSPYTLLVIDDDVQVLHHVREALQDRMMQVVMVSSVIEALRVLDTPQQDLVVASDLIIARSDGGGILGGIEILEKLRERDPNMPAILFSDYQNEEADERAKALNVTAQLVKPRKAQIYAEGKRGAATAPMRDFIARLESVLAPYLVPSVMESPASNAAARTAVEQPPTTFPNVPASSQAAAFVLDDLSPPTPVVAPGPSESTIGETTSSPQRTQAQRNRDVRDVTYDLREELASALDASGLDVDTLPPIPKTSGEMDALRSMVAEMRDASNHDAVSLLILRFASGVFERGALFLPTRRAFVGLGGFSQTEESEQFLHRVRRVQVPVENDSVFTQVVTYRTMVRSPMADVEGNRTLIDGLGGGWHRGEVVAVPLISGDKIAAILFGDNPSGKPVGPTDGLEIFLQQAGLVLERALLERKLEESRRRDRTPR